MPGARATANRKPPAFKPPRPAKKTTPNKTTSTSEFATERRAIAGSSRISKSQSRPSLDSSSNGGFKPSSRAIEISDDVNTEEEEDLDDDQDGQDTEEGDSDEFSTGLPSTSRRRTINPVASPSEVAPTASQDAPPPIPQKLLTRLLHEGFEDSNTKIGKDAMVVLGKYVELFVREAVARAAVEREGENGGGLGDEFLEVEDLEKLAPQLLLDF